MHSLVCSSYPPDPSVMHMQTFTNEQRRLQKTSGTTPLINLPGSKNSPRSHRYSLILVRNGTPAPNSVLLNNSIFSEKNNNWVLSYAFPFAWTRYLTLLNLFVTRNKGRLYSRFSPYRSNCTSMSCVGWNWNWKLFNLRLTAFLQILLQFCWKG